MVPLTARRFPYTTLFRSPRYFCPIHPHDVLVERVGVGNVREGYVVMDLAREFEAGTISYGDVVALPGERDRKSTRLNSSHVAISYAVFCLKKKKNSDLERAIPRPITITHRWIVAITPSRTGAKPSGADSSIVRTCRSHPRALRVRTSRVHG